jgi:hypothetical protein
MKRLLAALAMAVISLLSVAGSTALGHGNYARGSWDDGWYERHDWDRHSGAMTCNGTFTHVTIRNHVEVPTNGVCTLIDSAVNGAVHVGKGGYFQATSTAVLSDVEASEALTVFIDGGSRVAGSIMANKTAQVSLFDSSIAGRIDIYRSHDTVHVCGNTVKGAGIGIARSRSEILVGDPLAADCAGNRVTRGSVLLWKNDVDVAFVVRGNRIPRGRLHVVGNKGPSDKFVQKNTARKGIRCTGNLARFAGSPNFGPVIGRGQCGPNP